MEEFKIADPAYTGEADSLAIHNSVNISAGFRAGAEIMAGKHVGFNIDFLYQYSYFETMAETDNEQYRLLDGSISSYDKSYFSYLLPMIGIGLGVNFYF
jgi:hypothetical protein